jgi:hypothetical protein
MTKIKMFVLQNLINTDEHFEHSLVGSDSVCLVQNLRMFIRNVCKEITEYTELTSEDSILQHYLRENLTSDIN